MTALFHFPKQFFGAILLFLCAGAFYPVSVRSQPPGTSVADGIKDRVERLQAEIAAEEGRHAAAGTLGQAWLALGKLYESQLQEDGAEDAYAHALPLLRTASLDAQYADALHGLGTVCVSTARFAEGRKYLVASLAIYEKLQDRVHAAMLHQALAAELVENGKFKDAIAEASASLAALVEVENAPVETMIAGYILRSEAEYHTGENADALTDVARARAATARAGVADNSLERIAISLAEGAALTRAGQTEQGHAAIEEALRLASTRTDLPRKLHLGLQIWILSEYSGSLQAVHRKQDVRQIKAQVALLQSQLPPKCEGCTVSVAALHPPGVP